MVSGLAFFFWGIGYKLEFWGNLDILHALKDVDSCYVQAVA
ncbi:hypothetical protein predicted by Glimmer/Critica (plasmid) [Salmonella enterica subsp. enterica serovar Weltevreden str. 2007-60-3289-1]|nr:conserved hypothetical protein [Salmonella enterica subsp. enterica serovar Weltevreden str. HI_N05-537]CBY99009.1 hypothetical protein predicted by Glimmer/Critica [Salmonella enterica subsp. enterica serovar Weltevreden str. 2007-60-3289-1]